MKTFFWIFLECFSELLSEHFEGRFRFDG